MTQWAPLESNPEVLTKYIRKLGVSSDWELADVIGVDPEMLEWIPRPVKAIILLFPCSEVYEKHRHEENERLLAEPQEYPSDLYFMRQFTSNACGTVAIIHSIANNSGIGLAAGVLKDFLEKTKNLNPEERGHALENDENFTASHQLLAREGQTTSDPEVKVYHHFITLIKKDNQLYELDGRKAFPIKHGDTSDATFVADAARICRDFMARDPDEMQFVVMALVPTQF